MEAVKHTRIYAIVFFLFRDGARMAEAAIDLLPIDADGRSRMSRSLQVMRTQAGFPRFEAAE